MRFLIVLFYFFMLSISAQNYYKDFDPALKLLIDEGDACFKQNQSDCQQYYDKVLALAAQQPDSTLAMAYHEVGVSFARYGQLSDVLAYLNKGIGATQGQNHPLVTAALYRKKTIAFARLGMIDSILPSSQTAMSWAQLARDNETIADIYIQRSDLLHRMGNPKQALEVLQKAKPYALKSNSKIQQAGIDFAAGNIYLSTYDFKEAIVALERFMEQSKEDDEGYYRGLINWSMAMVHDNRPEPVIERLPEAISFFKDRNLVWTAKTHLAHAYAKLGQYDKSIPLHEECLAAAQQIYDPAIISLNSRLLAKGYLETDRPEKALYYSTSVYEYETSKGSLDEQVLGAYTIHSRVLGALGRKADAYDVLKPIPKLSDSLNSMIKLKEIKKLQELYETEKKEAQIALLEEKDKSSTLQIGMLIAGLIALLGILGTLWVRFRESKKRTTLERQKLDAEIAHKHKELTTHALHLAKKNQILVDLKQKVEQIKGACETRDIINTINFDLKDEASWENFTQYFEKVHTNFGKNVVQRYPNVTSNELRFMALLRMNLSSKEIANILNITPDGVKKARQRLRKKMELSPEDSLESEILNI